MNSRMVGLHLKLNNSLSDIANEATKYKINTFQFFLTRESTDKYIKLNKSDLKNFLNQTEEYNQLYIHSSYWINLASGKRVGYFTSQKLLKKEIALAKKLQIKNIVLHPGSATHFSSSTYDPTCKLRSIDFFFLCPSIVPVTVIKPAH